MTLIVGKEVGLRKAPTPRNTTCRWKCNYIVYNRVMEVSLESSFQPTIQLYLLFPIVFNQVEGDRFTLQVGSDFGIYKRKKVKFLNLLIFCLVEIVVSNFFFVVFVFSAFSLNLTFFLARKRVFFLFSWIEFFSWSKACILTFSCRIFLSYIPTSIPLNNICA